VNCPHNRPAREALRWLIALRENPDRATRARFAAWLSESEAHGRAWERVQHAFDAIGQGKRARRHLPPELRAPTRTAQSAFLAAVGMVWAATGLAALPPVLCWLEADHATGAAEIRRIALEDGSVIDLAPDSAVRIAYGEDRRVIHLIGGEAFFSVAPDADRRFEVIAGAMRTTASEGGFDVRMAPGRAAVAVRTGTVAIEGADERPNLLADGDWATLDAEGKLATGHDLPRRAGAWRQGHVRARDWTVAQLLREIELHCGGTIILGDPAIGRRRVSGSFDLTRPVAAIDAVLERLGLPAGAEEVRPGVILVGHAVPGPPARLAEAGI
jgi:transmembrane sensor